MFSLAAILGIQIAGCNGSLTQQQTGLTLQSGLGAKEHSSDVYVRVCYCYHTMRCPACYMIEILAKKLVEEEFSEELKSGSLVWETLNIDHIQNRWALDRYHITQPSLILSIFQNGQEFHWENLDRVWELYDDEEKFTAYVGERIHKSLTELASLRKEPTEKEREK